MCVLPCDCLSLSRAPTKISHEFSIFWWFSNLKWILNWLKRRNESFQTNKCNEFQYFRLNISLSVNSNISSPEETMSEASWGEGPRYHFVRKLRMSGMRPRLSEWRKAGAKHVFLSQHSASHWCWDWHQLSWSGGSSDDMTGRIAGLSVWSALKLMPSHSIFTFSREKVF